MKINILDAEEDYVIETIDMSSYDLDDDNDVEVLKEELLRIIETYVTDNL